MTMCRTTVGWQALLVVAASTALVQPQAQAPSGEWPQYLGPNRNGVAAAPIAQTAKLAIAWRIPFSTGRSGIATADDRIYTLGSIDERDYLFALKASDGSEIWRTPLGNSTPDGSRGPASTPAIAGDLVVALGSSCALAAVRMKTGEVAWQRNLAQDFKSRFAARGGCALSPLVVAGSVVVPTGAADGPRLVALDALSGKDLWTAADVPGSLNTSPGAAESGGTWQVLYHHVLPPGVSGVTALNARTGITIWSFDGHDGMSETTPLPLQDQRVLMQTWADSTVFEASGARRALWTSNELSALGPPPVFHGGHIYGFGGNSGEFFKCVDAATGALRWSTRIYRGFTAVAGDTLVVLSESSGFLRLIAAEPAAYRELVKLPVLTPGAPTQTPPSVARGRVYVRNLDELVAIDAR